MRVLYIIIIAAFFSTCLLWLGVYRRVARRWAACGAALGMALAGALLLLAVLPGNSFYGEVITQRDTQEKVIALTFDDGPYPPYTQQLLRVLREKKVHATFFMVAENAAQHPEIVKLVQSEGHEIALHAHKHQDLLKLNQEDLAANITTGKRTLESITGTHVQYMRPPHGFKDWQVLGAMQQAGLRAVNWSIIPRDWTNPGAERIAARVIGDAHHGGIVLLHDGDSPKMQAPREQTVQATARIIDELRAQGYEFVTVSELLKQ